jgi:hypothetical protein
MKIKKIGTALRFAWNLFLAGKTVKIHGRNVTLPKLDQSAVDVYRAPRASAPATGTGE